MDFQIVLPGYFETMRTPLLAGRTFTDADKAPNRNVVAIDQSLADKAFPRQSAVGKRILIRIRIPEPEWVEVIGVASHVRNVSLAEPGREQIYFTDAFLGLASPGNGPSATRTIQQLTATRFARPSSGSTRNCWLQRCSL